MLKRMKVDMPSFVEPTSEPNGSSSKGNSRATTVRDEEEDEAEATASVEFAPGNDADYFVEEDDEGRFFGGGLNSEQKTILDIFDKAGGEDALDDVSDLLAEPAGLTMLKLDVNSMRGSLSQVYAECC